ncbi:MAG TPA: hypothetical protein VFU46_03130 [Gemmatimonadales bacterium]|nr:hypothetical protein [Gemmatimonadales bacterium]
MAEYPWTEDVASISATLQTLENRVAQGDLAAPGLEEFKSAVDDLRLRAWGLLMATNADDYAGFQERFRIRRGKEICLALGADLHAGKLSGRHPELPQLREAASHLATAVDEARRHAF